MQPIGCRLSVLKRIADQPDLQPATNGRPFYHLTRLPALRHTMNEGSCSYSQTPKPSLYYRSERMIYTYSKFKINFEGYDSFESAVMPSITLATSVILFLMYRRKVLLFHVPAILMFSRCIPCKDSVVAHNVLMECVRSLQEELIARLAHGDALYHSDNKTIYMIIEKRCHVTSVESTVKAHSCAQNGRGVYMSLIDHHAGFCKYYSIMKKRNNVLQNIKWNVNCQGLQSCTE